jgi:hypothetical protein
MEEKGTVGRIEAVPRITRQRAASDPAENAPFGAIGMSDHFLKDTTNHDPSLANLLWCTARKVASQKEAEDGKQTENSHRNGASQGIGVGVVADAASELLRDVF